MKKLITIACVLAMLLVLTAVAPASAGEENLAFTINGTTTDTGRLEVKGCKGKFKGLTAAGSVEGSIGTSPFDGSFTFVEEGKGDVCELTGSNKGILTIVTDSGTLVIKFKGTTESFAVQGQWKTKGGTGDYARFKGEGTYLGIAAADPEEEFWVTFSGSIRTNSD